MLRTLVMGILNVTPNSFADGGKYLSKEDAITHGRRLIAEGADIIDVGGESTKPGAERVSQEDELIRVIPVITELVKDVVKQNQDLTNKLVDICKNGTHNTSSNIVNSNS